MTAKRILRTLLTLICLLHVWLPAQAWDTRPDPNDLPIIKQAALPAEARVTLNLIHSGGPYLYKRDGIAFQNREKRLPLRPRGYYREYTVPTPGSLDRGARRIISGARDEFYYSADHYRSFWRIQP